MIPAPPLTLLTLRLHFRADEAMTLPRWKGALLRGGLGRALRQALCDPACSSPATCPRKDACAYRTVFAPEGEAGHSDLQGIRDVPRPYAVQPPLASQTQYAPGDVLVFGLTLAGSARTYLPHVIHAFTALGQMGLGLGRGRATLTRVESIDPLSGAALPLLAGDVLHNQVLTTSGGQILTAAALLSTKLTLHFLTPMRLKYEGRFAETPECHILVRATLRRVSQLCAHFGEAAWSLPFGQVIAEAQQVRLRVCHTQWVEWSRLSGSTGQHMNLGGFVGSATYEGVSPAVGAVLLLGSLVHIGKASVFGHGAYTVHDQSELTLVGSDRPS